MATHSKDGWPAFRRGFKGALAACVIVAGSSAVLAAANEPGARVAQTIEQRIDARMKGFSGGGPGCAVGVAQNQKTLFTKAYGLADLEHNVPLSTKSLFYMASVSKEFTAMSTLMLVKSGKLSLDTQVRSLVPEVPAYADAVRVHHLLTHTSGIPDYFGIADGGPDQVFTNKTMLELLARRSELDFPAGSEYSYSNSGYVLLSQIIQKVSGKDLNAFAQEQIFAPLGMTSTRFQLDHSALVPNRAMGYVMRDKAWHAANSMLDVAGDGGLYSSVDDMLPWGANFYSRGVGGDALAVMETAATLDDGTPIDYGMGLVPGRYRGQKVVEHSGSLSGYRTEAFWIPGQKFFAVVLCNTAQANPGLIARNIAEIYLPDYLGVSEVALSAATLKDYAGDFELAPQEIFNVAVKDEQLALQMTGQAAELLAATGKDRFFLKNADERVDFARDGSGAVTALVLHQNGQDLTVKRVADGTAKTAQETLDRRIKDNVANPGSETFLRRHIAALQKGQPNYEEMRPMLAANARRQLPGIARALKRWGQVKSISFKRVTRSGSDVYSVTFDHANTEWIIGPFTADGKVGAASAREVPGDS